MKIFKATNNPKVSNEKFVGVYMDEEEVMNLTLISLGEGVNKSSLFRSVLISWMEDKDPISLVADRAFHSWRSKGEEWVALLEFKQTLQRELILKRIPNVIVDAIIRKFDELNKAS